MRYSTSLPTTTVIALLFVASGVTHACSAAPTDKEVCTKETCGNSNYGTHVSFVETPAEAAKQALAEEKLVFVLHVSGHFEKSQYT